MIAARAVLGIGGATLMPSTLALIRNLFHDPVLSGVLLEHFWWGSVFLINTPAMLLLLVLAPLLLPEFKTAVKGRFDLLSSVLSLAAVLPALALVGNAVFMTQYLQLVLGMGPLKAALWSLVPSVVVAGAAPLGAALAQKFDRAYVLGLGFVIAASGFGVLTKMHVESSLAGLVMAMSLITETIVGAVAPERAGSASALMETCSEFGGALGIAVLGSIGTAAYLSDLTLPPTVPTDAASIAHEGLAGATAVAAQLPVQLGEALISAARHSFSHSTNVAALVGTILLLTTAAAVTLVLRGTHPAPHAAEVAKGNKPELTTVS
ncbi:MFS transporter [Kribbella catacumbae]|uniref:MFS transporter n=1 Tax=Kribbella catacumbae TaxID=460086 RepID=UPI0003662B0D|nr:MFS transporter [Kribbella catacumbae]